MRTRALSPLLLLGLWACQSEAPSVRNERSLEAYARCADNGLVRSHTANGIITTVQLLPAGLCALREARAMVGADSCALDTAYAHALNSHAKQLTLIVNLAPSADAAGSDIMTAGVANEREFIQQAFDLNFNFDLRAELHCDGQRYEPVLSALENTYGLTKDRNITLVFVPTDTADEHLSHSEHIELTIDNDILGTGKQHFLFDRADLDRAPQPTI